MPILGSRTRATGRAAGPAVRPSVPWLLILARQLGGGSSRWPAPETSGPPRAVSAVTQKGPPAVEIGRKQNPPPSSTEGLWRARGSGHTRRRHGQRAQGARTRFDNAFGGSGMVDPTHRASARPGPQNGASLPPGKWLRNGGFVGFKIPPYFDRRLRRTCGAKIPHFDRRLGLSSRGCRDTG